MNRKDPPVSEYDGSIARIDPLWNVWPWSDQGLVQVIQDQVCLRACRALETVSTTCPGGCACGSKKSRRDGPTESTCFTAVWMQPPTPPSASALLQMCLPLPYPSSQLWFSASGMRGTFTMTGLQPVLLCLTTPNCKQLRMASVKPTLLVWRMYDKYMSSLTPRTRSALQWTCLITQDNTCPYPFAKCWCLGSNTTQITASISTTSQLVWSWRTTSLHTSLPH
jgi:hypothetical protein